MGEENKLAKIKSLRVKLLGDKIANAESGKIVKEKSFAFAIRIVKLRKYLVEEKKEFTLSGQLQDAGTSIGANVREAYRAESGPDFIHKLGVSLKECAESQFWLELLFVTSYITEQEFESMYTDAIALDKIITSIILTRKQNTGKSKK